LMGTSPVLVLAVFTQHLSQMAFTEDEQMIQTFPSHAANPSFRIGIGLRRAVGRENDFHALRGKYRIKAGRKLPVTIMQHKAQALPCILQLPHQMPCLLRYPGCCFDAWCNQPDESYGCRSQSRRARTPFSTAGFPWCRNHTPAVGADAGVGTRAKYCSAGHAQVRVPICWRLRTSRMVVRPTR
jgi:hypothetical protein